MEKLIYVDRRNTNCNKWDGQYKMQKTVWKYGRYRNVLLLGF